MSYGLRYITQAYSKASKLFTCYIYEQDYAGDSEYIEAGFRPFELNVLASSDDPFDPVLASELTALLDITDFTGEIPDLTTRNDKKYHVVLKAGALPEANSSTILWKMSETNGTYYLDANMLLFVNGVLVLAEYFNADGTLTVAATDTITIQDTSYFEPPVINPDTGWNLHIQEDNVDIYDVSTDVWVNGVVLEYSFVAGYQKVYTVFCGSYATAYDPPILPVNTIYDIFQGYILADATRLSFSSGRKFLNLSVSDGIAMLKSIPYEQNLALTTPSDYNGAVLVDINTTQTLLEVILQCLNKLELPDGFYLYLACNIYSAQMSEESDPFSQTLYYRRNWQNSDLTWQSCYDVLTTILLSWGCRIEQSEKDYWIINIEEAASGSLRYVKYNQDGLLLTVTPETIDVSRLVEPYLQDGSIPHYFVNGDQSKVIRKGYPIIELKTPYTYAPNLVDNGNFKREATVGTDIVYNWYKYLIGTGGSITIANAIFRSYLAIRLFTNNGRTSVIPLSVGRCTSGDSITLSFLREISTNIGAGGTMQVKIRLFTDSGTSYYVNNDLQWQLTDTYYDVVQTAGASQGSESITPDILPFNGNIGLEFSANLVGAPTFIIAYFGNVVLSVSVNDDYILAKGYDDSTSQYKKQKELVMGGQIGDSVNQTGALFYSPLPDPYAVYHNWYRFGYTESYSNLPRLILQQYINIQSAAQINMEGAIMSIFDEDGPIALRNTFYFSDTTTWLPVAGLPFICGNMRISYTDDEWSGTFLQVSNTQITETITDIITQKL